METITRPDEYRNLWFQTRRLKGMKIAGTSRFTSLSFSRSVSHSLCLTALFSFSVSHSLPVYLSLSVSLSLCSSFAYLSLLFFNMLNDWFKYFSTELAAAGASLSRARRSLVPVRGKACVINSNGPFLITFSFLVLEGSRGRRCKNRYFLVT